MRALQSLLITVATGSALAGAGDVEERGPGGWEIGPAAADDDDDAWVEQPLVALPVFFDEARDQARGASDDPATDAATDPVAAIADEGDAAGDEALFKKGTWSLQLTGSYFHNVTGSD